MNISAPSDHNDMMPDPAALTTLRTLVVDDDVVTNRLLCHWLRRRGYQTAGVVTGEDALSHLIDDAPDILFLDVGLPGLSGLQVLEYIREENYDVGVIVITASDMPETAITALRHRADDYLRKPLVFRECEMVLERTATRLLLRRQNALLRAQLDEKRRQLEAELSRAAEVQMGLLPREMPRVARFELAARCVPAREVGGDFYDWHQPDASHLTMTIGDVMGKGMPAALMMATTRATLHAVTSQNSPGVALSLAGQALQRDLDRSESFVTLFQGQLELATGNLRYADAGHGHTFVRRADGTTAELPTFDPPLGVLSNTTYTEGQITLAPGDTLIVYSDGLADTCPELVAQRAQLVRYLEGATTAQAMVDALVQLVDTGQPLFDDLTVIVLCCTESAAEPAA